MLDEDAEFLRLDPGADDFFAATHSHRGSYFVTARHMDHPEEVLARIDVNRATASATGDAAVWAHLPQFFGGWDNGNDFGNFQGYSVVRVDRVSQHCEVQFMEWLNANNYDFSPRSSATTRSTLNRD